MICEEYSVSATVGGTTYIAVGDLLTTLLDVAAAILYSFAPAKRSCCLASAYLPYQLLMLLIFLCLLDIRSATGSTAHTTPTAL